MEDLRCQFKGIIIPIAPSVLYDIQLTKIQKVKSTKSINISLTPFIEIKSQTSTPSKIKIGSPTVLQNH